LYNYTKIPIVQSLVHVQWLCRLFMALMAPRVITFGSSRLWIEYFFTSFAFNFQYHWNNWACFSLFLTEQKWLFYSLCILFCSVLFHFINLHYITLIHITLHYITGVPTRRWQLYYHIACCHWCTARISGNSNFRFIGELR
jgi:lipoprotein signal peptidase